MYGSIVSVTTHAESVFPHYAFDLLSLSLTTNEEPTQNMRYSRDEMKFMTRSNEICAQTGQ